MWQTEDQLPEYPRITQFLNYWDKNIDGPIKEVYIYDQGQSSVRLVDRKYRVTQEKGGVLVNPSDVHRYCELDYGLKFVLKDEYKE